MIICLTKSNDRTTVAHSTYRSQVEDKVVKTHSIHRSSMERLPGEAQPPMELQLVPNFQERLSGQPQLGNIPPHNLWHQATNSQEHHSVQPLLGNIQPQIYQPVRNFGGNTNYYQPPPSYSNSSTDFRSHGNSSMIGHAPYSNLPADNVPSHGNRQTTGSRQINCTSHGLFKLVWTIVVCICVTCALFFLLCRVYQGNGHEDCTLPCHIANVRDPRMKLRCNCLNLKEFSHINKTEVIEIIQQLHNQEIQDRARAISNTRMPNSSIECAANLILQQQADTKPTGMELEDVVGWIANGSQTAFIKPCISYNAHSGQFTILKGGTYLITSHLSFGRSSAQNTVFEQRIHSSVKTSPVLYDEGFDREKDLPDGRLGSGYNSVASSVVLLNDGEVLTVRAKPSALLSRDAASFFSLYKLGG